MCPMCAGQGRWCIFVFFFQAEDGIRDVAVTGVQTCALPISGAPGGYWRQAEARALAALVRAHQVQNPARSEERRVGKECRSRWSPDHEKKKKNGVGVGSMGGDGDLLIVGEPEGRTAHG